MEKINLEEFPTSESARKMLSYVSDGFYDESYVGKWIFQAMGEEYDKALEIAESLPEQFFPETATWGLRYHEQKWNLPVHENLPYDERRKLIYQKRDFRAPMTPYRMEEYLREAIGIEVHISDVHDPGEYGFMPIHPNVFKVYFIGEGTLDSKKAHELVNGLKQSHTAYILNDRASFSFNNIENLLFRSLILHMKVTFWSIRVLDGSYRLDGTALLNAQRRYALIMGQKCKLRSKKIIEKMLFFQKMRLNLFLKEKISLFRIYNKISLAVIKEGVKCPLTVKCNVIHKTEEIKSKVIIKRNLWLLNGDITLDGTRIMNASVKEEVL